MAKLELKEISKSYGKLPAVRKISQSFADGKLTVIVGPSGCGKTTTLRMIAGLENIDEGSIYLDDVVINELPSRARDMAMVFQRYSLYPHLSVRDNICFGLKARGCPREEMDKKVSWIADILHIGHLLSRRPNQLSGGEQQRVAIGRALVRNPRVYLLDEPLSNLDAKLRIEMREEIKRLHQQFTTTTIYVTHDQAEAMSLGDNLVVMNDGEIVQAGKPMDVYQNPEHIFVAEFIGNPAMNLIPGNITSRDSELRFINDSIDIPLPSSLAGPLQNSELDIDDEFVLGIRPEHIYTGGDIAGEVIVVEPLGAETLLLVRFGRHEMRLRIMKPPIPDAGSTLGCTFPPEYLHLFHVRSGMAVGSQKRN